MTARESQVWIDSHCHLTDPRFADRIDRVLGECLDDGISHFLQGGISPEEWDRQKLLAQKFPNQVSLVFGLHPWWVDEKTREAGPSYAPDTLFAPVLAQLSQAAPGITAIGEAGLDFARKRREDSGENQLWVFQQQLEIAKRYDKPLVLHIVQAHFETLTLLSRRAENGSRFRGLVHSFSGSLNEAKQYAALGFLISLGCRCLEDSAFELHRIIREIPLEYLVFETDSPDQAPRQMKDQPGFEHSPRSLLLVAEKVSQIRGIPAKAALDQATKNLQRVFTLKLFQ